MTMTFKLSDIWIVAKKEVVDGIRDRRSLGSLAFSVILSPVLFGLLFTVAAERRRSADEITLPVAGAEYGPALVDWLNQRTGVHIVAAPPDAEQAVRDRQADVIVIIEEDFSKNLARAIPAPVRLVADVTRDAARPKVTRVRNLLAAFSGEIGALRLISRGIAPSIAQAVRIDDVEVSSSQQRLAAQLNILPLLLVLVALTGSMQLAIDTTAGERERGSLEPLLLNPISHQSLAAGKWLAASLFGACAVVFSMLLTINVMRRVPWHDLGVRFLVTDGALLSLLGVVLPLVLLLSAIVMYTSTFARSFKEAHSYLGVLMLIPMLPGMLSVTYPLSNRPWLAPVPVIGQYALAADILGGNPPAAFFYVLAAVPVLVEAFMLVVITARLFGRESIVFAK